MSLDTHWLSYAELADRLGITGESARNLVRPRQWSRRPGNDGVQRVGVPAEYLEERAREGAASSDEVAIVATIVSPGEAGTEGAIVAALEVHISTLRGVVERERQRVQVERERDRADGAAAELVRARAERTEDVAGVERDVAELRGAVEAMKALAAEARAREAALEARIEAVRAEAAALRDVPWWRRLVG